jgi:hypothetical protein
MAPREYIKLTPVRQRGGFALVSAARSNLWLGQDHLLSVETEGYTESYKRFYFRDLQAITLRKTPRMLVLGLVTGALTGFFVLLTVGVSEVEGKWFCGVLAAVFAVPFVLNLIYGPTCACQLRTAVQTEDVPSLGRVRRARKIIARLRPLIAAAQGELNPDEIPQRMQELAAEPARRSASNDPNAPPMLWRTAAPPAPAPLQHYRGPAHALLSWLLLADLPLTVPHFFLKAGWLDALGLLMMLVTVGAAIFAIVKQQHTDLPAGLRAIPWISVGSMALSLLVGLGYGFTIAVSQPDALQDLSPMSDPFTLGMTFVTTTLSVVLGTLGLLWLRRFRAEAAAPAASDPAGTPAR